jgi:hypothetical protein
VFLVVGFIRGLERSLSVSGDPRAAVILSLGMGGNLEYSSIPMRTSGLVPASVAGIEERFGQKYVSPELYLGTEVRVGSQEPSMGLVRGVTRSAVLVRRNLDVFEGDWPGPGQVLVGRLAAAKLGATTAEMAVGQSIRLEGRSWQISGIFSAGGSAFESEIWCRLDGLQQAMKRQDLSLVAVTLARESGFANLDLFCKERLDLELQTMRETAYYASLQKDYGPVRSLAWLVVVLLAGAGIFAGMNTMYGSVVGRTYAADHRICPPRGRRQFDPGGAAACGRRQFACGGFRAGVHQRDGRAVHDGGLCSSRRQRGDSDRLWCESAFGVFRRTLPSRAGLADAYCRRAQSGLIETLPAERCRRFDPLNTGA